VNWASRPAGKRAAAIKAAKLSRAQQGLLLDINKSIGDLSKDGGPGVVGAWGLGCGSNCSRPGAEFGNVMRRR